MAARVFVQYLSSVPKDSQVAHSLRFLLYAMNALKKKNPLTESFLVQLDVDLEGLGMRNNRKFQEAPWEENFVCQSVALVVILMLMYIDGVEGSWHTQNGTKPKRRKLPNWVWLYYAVARRYG